MSWNICLIVSILIICLTVISAIAVGKSGKSGAVITPFNLVFFGVFLAIAVSLIPIYLADEQATTGVWYGLKLVLIDLVQTFQVFTINAGGDFILENIRSEATAIGGFYSLYESILFVGAPILTFGFLASLLKNAFSIIHYGLHRWGDVYVFSELNEKSVLLVQDIRKNHRNAMIVFTNVDKDEGDIASEYISTAKKLNALIFKKDVLSVNLMNHAKKAEMTFFIIGTEENENLRITQKLLSIYKGRENTNIYVFSTGTDSELLLANSDYGKVKLRRINESRSLVYDFLYDEGISLFEHAKAPETLGLPKKITALIVGLGKDGIEMLKALSWYCQMNDDYTLEIHAIDEDPLAEERFTAMCPELMTDARHEYNIHIYSDINWETATYANIIKEIGDMTFAFISLGADNVNIACAAELRMHCERIGCKPTIKTVIRSSEVSNALTVTTNFKGQTYDIEPMGEWENFLTEKSLMESELEKLALRTHLKWGNEEEFWQYEYNYRSSMASAIHMKAKIAFKIPGAGKAEEDLTEEEKAALEPCEHRRWNAYMRSEGYVYSGSPDKSSRNDLAKMHHNILEFEALSEEDKRKDSAVTTK